MSQSLLRASPTANRGAGGLSGPVLPCRIRTEEHRRGNKRGASRPSPRLAVTGLLMSSNSFVSGTEGPITCSHSASGGVMLARLHPSEPRGNEEGQLKNVWMEPAGGGGGGGGGGGAGGRGGGRGGLRAINHGDTRDWSEALSVHNADQTLYIFDITQPERSGGCAPLCQIKKDIQATKAIIQSKRRSA